MGLEFNKLYTKVGESALSRQRKTRKNFFYKMPIVYDK